MRRIAIVDDSVEARQLMRMLVGMRYDVYGFESGTDFLRALDSQEFDLVLLDIILHGELDGIEVGAAIRERYPAGVLPVIAVSGDTRPETQEAASRAGIDAYVIKPITDFERFFELIETYLTGPAAA